MLKLLAKLFGGDSAVLKSLESDLKFIETDYEMTAQRIQDARDWAHEVAVRESQKFADKKGGVIAQIQLWLASMEESIMVDHAEIEAYYEDVKKTLDDKLTRVHAVAEKAEERAAVSHSL